jgi:predicted ATP-binding protein involved in virulence
MRINELKIRNFRCFEDATFKFAPQFNLLVGVNGSGKTSLLKALVAAVATPFMAVRHLSSGWPHVKEEDTRFTLLVMQGRSRYEQCYPVRLEIQGELCGQPRNWWVAKEGAMSPGSVPLFEHTAYSVITDAAAHIAQTQQGALPVMVFYSAQRQWQFAGVSPEKAATQQDSRFDGYQAWNDAALDMKGLETWVIAKSLERLEASAEGESDRSDDELALVNSAIVKAFPDAKGLRYDTRHRRILLEKLTGEPVPFNALSDGQRAVCALVADIARRMCLLNPQLGSDVMVKTPGVIAIDELDMHLHPAWQRRIAGVLKETFPLVQFFAASHSPQIIGELPAHEILLLRDGHLVGHPERALGLDSDDVLTEVMGAPAQNTQLTQALTDIRHALEDEKLDEAQQHITRVSDQFGNIPDVLEVQAALKSLRWMAEDAS